MFKSLKSAVSGLLFEESAQPEASVQGKPVADTKSPTIQFMTATAMQSNEQKEQFVLALRSNLSNKNTPFTTLLVSAKKLESFIPEQNMRLKAAYETIKSDGMTVADIISSIDYHSTGLDKQKSDFSETVTPAHTQLIANLTEQNKGASQTIEQTNTKIAELAATVVEYQALITKMTDTVAKTQAAIDEENAAFEFTRTQFDSALAQVKTELESQKSIISAALA